MPWSVVGCRYRWLAAATGWMEADGGLSAAAEMAVGTLRHPSGYVCRQKF